ncbi:hypothetical protein BpHYR1_044344 [Brachionus plicatilis]|uniref:Uncharacterized protein n=1 Tax=Brachionus plicatilis TaxID=10195 RepID=A0A3M7QQL1_BRAPC|nr:hypothetical protein BpHYR1_044344 [Brachionus plicatilis]
MKINQKKKLLARGLLFFSINTEINLLKCNRIMNSYEVVKEIVLYLSLVLFSLHETLLKTDFSFI